jgi:hypothetical protein
MTYVAKDVKYRHEQTAIEDRRGWWRVECDCGAVGESRPTNYEAWQVTLAHRPG